ncbi:MAG: DUF1178 family protein [Alphaproteobacteria bacterium]|nr:DUF1178 family protein [Alphaproteobacteria bacterium]
MIHYGFYCDSDHEFDEWFDSIADYERKAEAGELACPECGSHEVKKAIAAPNVARGAASPAPACGMAAGPGCGGCAFAEG